VKSDLRAQRLSSRLVRTVAAVAVIGVGLPFLIPAYWVFLCALGCVDAVAVLSIVVLARATASVSLCQAAFMGIAAYSFAWFFNHQGWPLWISAPLGALVVVPVGMLLAFPALRVRGLELSVLTLSVGLATSALVFGADAPIHIGGINGAAFNDVVKPFGFDLSIPRTMYWFQFTIAFVVFVGVALLLASPIGVTWRALRAGNAVAAASGIRITNYQLLGFGVSAFLAGVAGVMLLFVQSSVAPEQFGAGTSIFLVVLAMVAGVDRISTAILAGFAFGIGQQVFPTFGLNGNFLNLATGFVLVIAIVARGERRSAAALAS
jgi:branched-chain amino acid transport system permease protein